MTVLAGVTTGASSDFFAAGDFVGSKFTAVASGTADTMNVVLNSNGTATTITLGIYTDASGVPGNKLGQTSAISGAATGTKTASLLSGVPIVSGTVYWLVLLPLGGTCFPKTTTGGGYKGASGQSTLADPFPAIGFTDPTVLVIDAESTGGGAANALVGGQRRFPQALLIR